MPHQLGNAHHLGGDDRRPLGHGLHKHRGQAIAVAVGADHAGSDKKGGLTKNPDQLRVGSGPGKADLLSQTKPLDSLLQRLPHHALAHYAAVKSNAPLPQQAAGLDQHIKTLFLHQPAHGQDFPAVQIGGLVRKTVQMQAVVDTPHLLGRPTIGGLQIALVIAGDRDHARGIAQLPAHILLIDCLMINVLGVYGQGIGNAGKPRGNAGDGRRKRAKMGVKMGNPALARLQGQLDGLKQVSLFHVAQLIQSLPETRQFPAGKAHHLPEAVRGGADVADIGDRRPDLGQNILKMAFPDRPQSKDVDSHPGLFVFKNFIDDKGFREARVAFEHIGQRGLLRCRHDATLLERVEEAEEAGSAATWADPNMALAKAGIFFSPPRSITLRAGLKAWSLWSQRERAAGFRSSRQMTSTTPKARRRSARIVCSSRGLLRGTIKAGLPRLNISVTVL